MGKYLFIVCFFFFVECGDLVDVVFVMDLFEGIGEYIFGCIKGYVDYFVW